MARAYRHYISGHIWHITHRCHKREFLLKFSKDRHQWLYEARKRYGLIILDNTVTSNHIHLLAYDATGNDVISRSIQLVAGRTEQEYNQRKKSKGAFWEDRYHAAIIEDGEHLLRCIVYIDMNIVISGLKTTISGKIIHAFGTLILKYLPVNLVRSNALNALSPVTMRSGNLGEKSVLIIKNFRNYSAASYDQLKTVIKGGWKNT